MIAQTITPFDQEAAGQRGFGTNGGGQWAGRQGWVGGQAGDAGRQTSSPWS